MSLYELVRNGQAAELRDVATSSSNAAVRRRAAELLGECESEDETIETLVDLVATDDDARVRASAVTALDELGREPLERLVARLAGVDEPAETADWRAARQYRTYLESEQPELRLAATTVLGRLDVEEVAPAIADRLEDDHARVRARAARTCGRFGSPLAESALAAALADDDSPAVRREAAIALGEFDGARPPTPLLRALDDPSEDVRRAATAALGTRGHPTGLSAVVDALSDPATVVRRTAAFALVDLLAAAPADRSHHVRETIVEELASVEQSDGVLAVLVDVLSDAAETHHRRNVAWLLGQIVTDPTPNVIDALVTALEDDDTVARFAATSLATVDGPDVEAALSDLLADPGGDGDARAMAAFALGDVGGELARERLAEAVETTDDDAVRRRAMAALSKLGGAT